ncbi:hypothetical protein [Rhizobium sp. SL86]|jgi:hypothetical protein|uniref:hypothetical protein n=1 Tax=Rhizobium sp. SL86 TaxID=2995148 RepID=UPI0022748305|nr:hypothetical protein [Rhizobium sp. SL86]MCY1668290.1 hypothetical protein [Rhizobium sp. SL86]
MSNLIAKVGLVALMAVTGLVAPVSGASAADGGLRGPDLRVEVQWHGDNRGPDRGRPDGDRYDRDRHGRRDICAPWLAEDKASRMGLRRARVVDVNRRVVVVAGFDRGGRDRVVFANERGCPLIRR